MTQEEKARAYDEAMNKIKPLYEQAKKDGNPIWSTYEYLIPELAESEDERIRKFLVDFFASYKIGDAETKLNGVRIDDILAYLEKQKVKVYDDTPYYTPEEVNAKIEEPTDVIPKIPRQEYLYHLLANGVITFSDYEFLMRNKGRKPADLSEMMVHKEPYIAPVPTPMIADEQKPIPQEERNDEKNILEDIIVFVSGYADKRVVTKWVSFLKSHVHNSNMSGARKKGKY